MEGEGKQQLSFTCPARGLIGFRSAFATLTRGSGLMHRAFSCYGPFQGAMDQLRKGAIVSMAGGPLLFFGPVLSLYRYQVWHKCLYARQRHHRLDGTCSSHVPCFWCFSAPMYPCVVFGCIGPCRHCGLWSLHCQRGAMHGSALLCRLMSNSRDGVWGGSWQLWQQITISMTRGITLWSFD